MTEEKQLVKGVSNEELRLMALELSMQRVAIAVDMIERRMQKWDEVYYHVFPDRLEKDVQFERQLTKLMSPPKDGDGKK